MQNNVEIRYKRRKQFIMKAFRDIILTFSLNRTKGMLYKLRKIHWSSEEEG